MKRLWIVIRIKFQEIIRVLTVHKILPIFIFFIIPVLSFAGSELVGTTNSNFVKIPPFARAAGMGEAFTAVSDGTYGLYYNPAGMTSLLGYQIQATHISWFQGLNYEFLALVTPSPFNDVGKVGAAIAWFQVDEMPNTNSLPSYDASYLNSGIDLNEYVNSYFMPFDFSIIFAYALDIGTDLSAGISLKFNSQNIDIYNGATVSGDAGIIYKGYYYDSFVRLGLTVSNLGPALKMENEGFESPIIVKVGMSDLFTLFDNKMLIAAQAIIQVDYESVYSLGAEYWLYDLVCLRFGYKTGAFEHPTFGAGFRIDAFEINYAFINFEELGATHRISALYSWGTPSSKLKVSPYVFSPNNDKFKDNTFFRMTLKAVEQINNLDINIFDFSGIEQVASIKNIKTSKPNISWNGIGNDKITLKDGTYLAQAEAKYSAGTSISPKVEFEIDNTPPKMTLDAEPKMLRPGHGESLVIPATFTFSAMDKNGVADWKFIIWDEDKKVFFSASGKGTPPLSIIWDGKSNDGRYVKTGDIHYFSLFTRDTLGNMAKTPPESQVMLLKEIRLTFSSDALFTPGEANVKISAYHIMKTMKTIINQFPESNIVVEGYTDNMPTNGIKYKNNTVLSKKRADAVKFFMVNLLSMNEKRISTVGYGELNPIASNDTLEGRLKNRRVEIKIQSTIYK